MNPLLTDRVCLIAGTTGIGGASARRFAQEGAKIVAVGRSPTNAAALGAELDALGAEHLMIAEDLANPDAEQRVLAAALARFGRVDVLFHVAGISGRSFGDGPLADCSDAGWDTVMAINLRAMMRLNRACIQHWRGTGRPGVILNMASVLGYSFVPDHFQTVGYAAAKAAIIGMSQHAAGTYARDGIRINVIAPALVDTPMASRATTNPAILDLLKRKQPLTGKPLTDDDCARAALYLCSDLSAGVTGIVHAVDAGWCVCG
jgi:NAD(P)-dependent dehydrogenase (short-subunit alcohol dehydrogenase family)